MEFKDRVKKHLRKQQPKEPEISNEEEKKRKNYIGIIEAKVGTLDTINFDKISTKDLFKIANALSGHMRK